jgi:DNA-binding NarL/FixJ family response regulator
MKSSLQGLRETQASSPRAYARAKNVNGLLITLRVINNKQQQQQLLLLPTRRYTTRYDLTGGVDEADGSELTLALIRALADRGHIGVVLLALALDGEWVRGALNCGARAVIAKSVHPAALATLIREAIAGHIFHAPRLLAPARPVAPPSGADHASLTEREREILRLVSSGATNGVIARELWITQQTVKFHVSNIYRKLGVANRTEACHYAHLNGIVPSFEQAVARQPALIAHG